jgi:glutaredoxin
MRKFVILTQDGCRFCEDAKRLLQANGEEYEEIKVDLFAKEFLKAMDLETVPQIFEVLKPEDAPNDLCIYRSFVGGFHDLEIWLSADYYGDID